MIGYDHSPMPVRADLADAHQRAWRRLARPGTWFTGAERVAMAQEARAAPTCTLCMERKAALSPYAVSGEHTSVTDLPAALIEVVHRTRTDAGRLTRKFFDDAIADGVTDGHYVEAIGVLATVVAVDSFCDAMGLPRHDLPEPVDGAPSRHRPEGARDGLAWVPTVAPEDVTEAEAGMYDGLAGVNIHRALSLVPGEVVGFFDLDKVQYLPDTKLRDFGVEYRDLTHAQTEFLAARVSAINQCVY